MAETATSAETLVSNISGEETSPNDTDTTPEEVEGQEETPEQQPETDATQEDDLPEGIREILKKNRKLVRDAEARAIAAEKALAAKDAEPAEQPAPVDDKFKKLFINTAAKSALSEAGLTTGTDRFLKMIDFDNIDVDDDGVVSGLDTQIADLKDEFKDLITPKEPVKKPIVKIDGAGRRETPEIPKSSADRLAAMINNK